MVTLTRIVCLVDCVHPTERRVFRKYIVDQSPDCVVLRMAFLDDKHMFEELSFRVVSAIVLAVGRKDTPPRLAAVSRLVRELWQLETGKTLTLGGCRVRSLICLYGKRVRLACFDEVLVRVAERRSRRRRRVGSSTSSRSDRSIDRSIDR